MKRVVVIFICLVLVLVGGIGYSLFSMSNYGPKFADVKNLLEPKIAGKAPEKVIVVETVGDPKKTFGPAFGLLYKTYFKLKGVPKGKAMKAPRARWPKPASVPKKEWVGIYAIPVPPRIETLPSVSHKTGLSIKLDEWKYGEVAEILHVGPYSREEATIEKLKRFIADNNYEICGDHEEEYLKGPTYWGNNPEKYLTIIRYPVRKITKN
jgi:hypothetical protein